MTANLPAPVARDSIAPELWRSTRGLRTALTWLLAVDAVAAIVGVAAHLNRVSVIDDIKSFSATLDQARAADDFVTNAAWIYIVPFVATAVVLIIWQWRSAKNNEVLGRLHPRYTPGWSIGGWFIPLANLVIPVRVFQDLWQGSEHNVGNYQDWRGLPRSRLIGWWWGTYIAGNLLVITVRGDQTLDQLRQADQANAVGSIFTAVAAVLAIVVIRAITERQDIARSAGRTAASGWYTDPTGRFDHRYWSGSTWTHHVSRNGEADVDSVIGWN